MNVQILFYMLQIIYANVLCSYLAAYSLASCILITVLVIEFAKWISKSKQLAVLKCMCLYYPLQSMVPYRIIEFLIVDERNKKWCVLPWDDRRVKHLKSVKWW